MNRLSAPEDFVYDDEGTRGHIRSDGTNAQCEAVLDALGIGGMMPFLAESCFEGDGCGLITATDVLFRCTAPGTTAHSPSIATQARVPRADAAPCG